MGSKTSTNANYYLFLSMNLLCHVLSSAACDPCNATSSPPPLTPPPSVGQRGGHGQGQQRSTCPRDALKLGVCAKLLGEAVDVEAGSPPTAPCCAVLAGVLDLEAAVCFCTAIKATVLGININIPVTLSLLLSKCGLTPPIDFVCA